MEAVYWRPCTGGRVLEPLYWRPFTGGHVLEAVYSSPVLEVLYWRTAWPSLFLPLLLRGVVRMRPDQPEDMLTPRGVVVPRLG